MTDYLVELTLLNARLAKVKGGCFYTVREGSLYVFYKSEDGLIKQKLGPLDWKELDRLATMERARTIVKELEEATPK
jgi:hypothetical protein